MLGLDSFHTFGTPLEPISEDEVPAKKPVYIEDQIVTDENGRRRFHGAFTGGFSAGYWNTVGSQEGWTPQSFKSSRSEKAPQREQLRPEDFMDDEDMGEFGIAPKRVQPREGYTREGDDSRKRKFMQPGLGPIPGTPVLHELLKPINNNVAEQILMNMGWRRGQGVGARKTRKEKALAKERNKREIYLLQNYGVFPDKDKSNKVKSAEFKDESSSCNDDNEDDADDNDDDGITFAPDDMEPYIIQGRTNRYGLGYEGLSRDPVLSKGSSGGSAKHFNLIEPLELLDRNNKKVTISGQAFGVGALEEEDDDIYERDDMSKYDFTLDKKKTKKKTVNNVREHGVIEGFVAAKNPILTIPCFVIQLPPGFIPRNWSERKSRFQPIDPKKAKELEFNFKKCNLNQEDLTPHQRGKLLGEKPIETSSVTSKIPAVEQPKTLEEIQKIYKTREQKTKELLERISAKSSNFTQGGIITSEGEEKPIEAASMADSELSKEHLDLLEKAKNKTKYMASSAESGEFKPFLGNPAKQKRYEEFLEKNLKTKDEINSFLEIIQPINMSAWDREKEKKEFIQAKSIYKPLEGLMSQRFVSETVLPVEKVIPKPKDEKAPIVTERTKTMWKPNSLLCKRYNIAEPFGGTMVAEKKEKTTKLSVFDYIECSVNKKSDFQTPVIIPKNIELPKAIIRNTETIKIIEKKEIIPTKESIASSLPVPKESKTPNAKVESVSSPNKSFKFVPKTDLEKWVVESKDKRPAQKQELYKAIFADSDSDEETVKDDQKDEENKVNLNSADADILPSFITKPTSAAAVNILRNMSPPRGIFAALFTSSENKKSETAGDPQILHTEANAEKVLKINPKVTFRSKSERCGKKDGANDQQGDFYGPKIPECIQKSTIDNEKEVLSANDCFIVKSTAIATVEEWVEKPAAGISTGNSTSYETESSSDSDRRKKKIKKSKKKMKKSDRKHEKKSKKSSKPHKSKKHKKR